jgi:simple sugar transport system ATP-binding protein
MMVGRDLPPPLARAHIEPGPEVLIVNDLRAEDDAGLERLRGVSFSVRAGEVFALAGVDGNGQAELADVIGGLSPALQGTVTLNGADVTQASVRQRLAAGLAHIPADRGTTGLIGAMTIAENLALRESDAPPFRRGPWLDLGATRALAEERIAAYAVRADGPDAPIATLSGGNQQKVIVAREIGRRPALLLAVQPTRGLDPGATHFVIEQVLALRAAGAAVLYISTELEEVMAVADRIGVIFDGRLMGVMRRGWADVTKLGLMMAGAA